MAELNFMQCNQVNHELWGIQNVELSSDKGKSAMPNIRHGAFPFLNEFAYCGELLSKVLQDSAASSWETVRLRDAALLPMCQIRGLRCRLLTGVDSHGLLTSGL